MNNFKKVENALYNYKAQEMYIRQCEKNIKLIELDYGAKGICYEEMAEGGGSGISNPTEQKALSNIDKKDKLIGDIKRVKRQLESIDEVMELLNKVEKTIIEKKYIKGLQWWQITSEVQYGERHCRRMKDVAINKMVIGLNGTKDVRKMSDNTNKCVI